MKREHSLLQFVEAYLANIQDQGLARGRVHGVIKHVRTFYRVNGVDIKLQEPLSRRVTYKDRAPTPEEMGKILEIGDLREKTIVALMTTGSFREDTVSKLEYRHVREDLEAGRVPIQVHVEAEIVKGEYTDYETFLGPEASEYLNLYLDQRRHGSHDRRNPPEFLTDTSPLIRDLNSHKPRPIGPKQIRKVVHNLYAKAGLLKKPKGRMYELRVHTLRKYFKTQLIAHGVPSDYADYMMGHKSDTYHDIQSLGVEKLRNVYAASGLSMKPKAKASKTDLFKLVKEMIRAYGENPEQILTREALSDAATTRVEPEDHEAQHLHILSRTLRNLILQDADGTQSPHRV